MSLEQIILEEIRELRKEVQEKFNKVGEKIETVEKRTSSLEISRGRIKGFAAAIASIPTISVIMGFFIKHHIDK